MLMFKGEDVRGCVDRQQMGRAAAGHGCVTDTMYFMSHWF